MAGYITGLKLANKYGFTTQNPSYYEICSTLYMTKDCFELATGTDNKELFIIEGARHDG
ncbi:MAG: hypothetical protein IKR56_03635 [Lachnospiraceae bacterium]|nr:hypothetical protein [Lachnospiraceae bacterium]